MCFFRGKYDEASEKYTEAITHDQENEYAVANLGVIALKKLEYEKCIEYSTKALKLIDSF